MKKLISMMVLFIFAVVALAGCGSSGQEPANEENNAAGAGMLQFTANPEDFVRQGFVTKDGWKLSFENVYVNLANVTAYQSDPPYDPDTGGEVSGKVVVGLEGTSIIDLAEGDENASPILVAEAVEAPAGHYNAISWDMTKIATGPAAGYSLVINGKAEKDDRTIGFIIKDENEYGYIGGEYIGDERKGIVTEGSTADIEMTFHFDHIFGDADTPADDELNVGAPGFEPFAALAEGDTVDVDMTVLKEKMSAEDFAKLEAMLPTLGHVGEGHCHAVVK
ncbi:MAG: DUF4382 domain-containing protein [Desulfotomaculaceae bacterium]